MVGEWLDERGRNGGVDELSLPGVSGRLWLCGKHLVGPDPEAALVRTGAASILCLNQPAELQDRYPDYTRWLTANTPERAVWFPVPDLHAPGVDAIRPLLDDLHQRATTTSGVLVHCGAGAGIGRAGTVAAALLLAMGVSLPDALAQVASCRPTAGPEAGAQMELLQALATPTRGRGTAGTT